MHYNINLNLKIKCMKILIQKYHTVITVAQSNRKIVDALWVESTLIHFVKINY